MIDLTSIVVGTVFGGTSTYIVSRFIKRSNIVDDAITRKDMEKHVTSQILIFESKCSTYRSTCPGREIAASKFDSTINTLRKEMSDGFQRVNDRIDKLLEKEG